jgi:hypothetical protein
MLHVKVAAVIVCHPTTQELISGQKGLKREENYKSNVLINRSLVLLYYCSKVYKYTQFSMHPLLGLWTTHALII